VPSLKQTANDPSCCKGRTEQSINTCMYSTYSINTKHASKWYLERQDCLYHAALERPATRRSCHDTHVLALALLRSLFLLFADDAQKDLV
jgi:hypothetical protein